MIRGMTARHIASRVRSGEMSATEAVTASLSYIEVTDGQIHSFLHVDREGALARAKNLDQVISEGRDPGPLAGVPVAVKDNICTRGIPTTCASRILEGFVPPYSATVVEKLTAAGAVVVGKTNMDEFAMGSSSENSAYAVTTNPWDLDRVPGGSSAGSATAVASGQVPLALGSDTGGSIRQPASFTGITGFKPTYGHVSRYGLVAFASSLDQIGPMARDAGDCGLALSVISGRDPLDSTSAPLLPYSLPGETGEDLRNLRVGVVDEYLGHGVDDGIKKAVLQAVDVFGNLGAQVGTCSLPHTEYALPAYYLIAPAEASSNLSRYDGIRYGPRRDGDGWDDIISRTRAQCFGPEVKRRIMLGTYALSAGYYDAFYLKASRVRTLIAGDFSRAFQDFDILIGPTAPTTAFPIGDRVDDPLAMYMSDILTISVNMAGLPAISVPCGLHDGLPVGLHIIGPAFQDARVLLAAAAYQSSTGHHRLEPPFSGKEVMS